MAYATVAGTNSGNSAYGTSHTIAFGATPTDGEKIIFMVQSGEWTDQSPNIFNTPSGWTLEDGYYYSSSPYFSVSIFSKTTSSEGTSVTVTTKANSVVAYAVIRITEDTWNDIEIAGTEDTGSDDSPDPPSLSPSWGSKENLWIAMCAYDHDSRSVSSYPTNYSSNQVDQQSSGGNEYGGGVSLCTRANETGTENPGTYTLDSSTAHFAQTICIEPVAAGGISIPVVMHHRRMIGAS